jgi:hypothetical protein
MGGPGLGFETWDFSFTRPQVSKARPGPPMLSGTPRGSAKQADNCKESRMKVGEFTQLYRKSGGMGHPR